MLSSVFRKSKAFARSAKAKLLPSIYYIMTLTAPEKQAPCIFVINVAAVGADIIRPQFLTLS
jgi:hypothetical protein